MPAARSSTEDEIKKITAQATDVAKASAVSKRFEVRLAPTEAYTDYWAAPTKVDPDSVSLDDKLAFLMKINEAALKQPDVMRVQSQISFDFEWKYLATSEGSYLEQQLWRTFPSFTVTARKGNQVKSRNFTVPPRLGGYEVALEGKMLENVERIAAEAAEHCTAPPIGVGLKDVDHDALARDADDSRDRRPRHRARSHRRLRGQLRGHELREDRAISAR